MTHTHDTLMALARALGRANGVGEGIEIEKAEAALSTAIAELIAERDALREAADALLSNEEHAWSGGMRTYQEGSPTWEIWEAVRQAMKGAPT